MNITQKIFASLLAVILLLLLSLASVFAFHIYSLREYKDISDTLVLENALSYRVTNLITAFKAVEFAPDDATRLKQYVDERNAVRNTLEQLDLAISNDDSKVAYNGLKNIIEHILADLDAGYAALKVGDIVASGAHSKNAFDKRAFLDSNVTELILTELHYLDSIQNDIQESYRIQLRVVGLWTAFVVLLVTAYSFVFSRKLTLPIIQLSQLAERISHGSYQLETPGTLLHERDEIGSLAQSFDRMLRMLKTKIVQTEMTSAQISEAKQRLEERNADLVKAQTATANLLEDLEEEKRAVEHKVQERTEDLRMEREKLLQVTQYMKGGGLLFDEHGAITFVNTVAYRLLGIDSRSSYEEVMNGFFSYFANTPIRDHFDRCLKRGLTFHVGEIDGRGRVYEMYFRTIRTERDDSGKIRGYFLSFSDITEAKMLERSKSELVAVASHQLRTPLTAMRGNVEMLVDESYGPLNKEQRELLSDINVSTTRLISMVNDMLDITKIEKEDLEMKLEDVSIQEIIESILSDLTDYAARHEFTITCHNMERNVTVYADKMRVRQVVQNLVDNAIKYSIHPGKLDITLNESDLFVQVTFKDNGIGVPKVEQPKLFGRFYRASNTAKAASSGSGLGLYIVRSIVRQLGGDIWFESEENAGTAFFVTFPKKEIVHKHSLLQP